MVVEYKGKWYNVQQMWALVQQVRRDGWHVYFSTFSRAGWAVLLAHINDSTKFFIGRSEECDKTPFRALTRALREMSEAEKPPDMHSA